MTVEGVEGGIVKCPMTNLPPADRPQDEPGALAAGHRRRLRLPRLREQPAGWVRGRGRPRLEPDGHAVLPDVVGDPEHLSRYVGTCHC